MNTASTNGTKAQLTSADLSYFLDSCQTFGLKLGDFNTVFRIIFDHVIKNTDDRIPTHELKIPLLFLRQVEIFLNSIKID
ncbi:MAG: hypothetical protein E6Q66_09885 [Pedobacter sp.]|nr:MAG: hypothetical protein E6Q66_09885 [Pedobacter sp.]